MRARFFAFLQIVVVLGLVVVGSHDRFSRRQPLPPGHIAVGEPGGDGRPMCALRFAEGGGRIECP
jgi:hypothetical protein